MTTQTILFLLSFITVYLLGISSAELQGFDFKVARPFHDALSLHRYLNNDENQPYGYTLLFFYSPICGRCKNFINEYDQIATYFREQSRISDNKMVVTVGTVNCNEETNDGLCRQFGVQNFPHVSLISQHLWNTKPKEDAQFTDYSIKYTSYGHPAILKDFVETVIINAKQYLGSETTTTQEKEIQNLPQQQRIDHFLHYTHD